MKTNYIIRFILRGCLAVTISAQSFVNVNAQTDGESLYKFQYNDIIYACHKPDECQVVRPAFGYYSGDIVVPSIAYDERGVAYKVTRIDDYACSNCPNLTSVILSYGLESIGYSAFSNNESLTAINLPPTLTSIGIEVLSNCPQLSLLYIPGSIKMIPFRAFSGCSGLTEVFFDEGLESIDTEAFAGSGIREIVLPKSLKALEQYAFANCKSLSSTINLPQNLSTFYADVFENSILVKNVKLDPQNPFFKEIDGMIYTYDGKKLVYANPWFSESHSMDYYMPKGATTLGYKSFNNAYFNFLSIPEGVEEIQDGAFYHSDIKTLVLPSTVNKIGEYAFSLVTYLVLLNPDPLYFYNELVEHIHDDYTSEFFQKTTLVVPKGCVEKYRAANLWKEFATITDELPADCPPLLKCETPTYFILQGSLNYSSPTEGARCEATIDYSYYGVGVNGGYQNCPIAHVTIIATKDGYAPSDPCTFDIPMSFGSFGDLNADGSTNVGDEVVLRNFILQKR